MTMVTVAGVQTATYTPENNKWTHSISFRHACYNHCAYSDSQVRSIDTMPKESNIQRWMLSALDARPPSPWGHARRATPSSLQSAFAGTACSLRMAKSIRSKVKRAYRKAARERLAVKNQERLEQITGKLYDRIGFVRRRQQQQQQQASADTSNVQQARHRGAEIATNFVPTPEPPRLNCVHGPLAERAEAKGDLESMVVVTPQELNPGDERETILNDRAVAQLAVRRRGTNSQRRDIYRPPGKKKHVVTLKPISKRHPQNKRAVWKQRRV